MLHPVLSCQHDKNGATRDVLYGRVSELVRVLYVRTQVQEESSKPVNLPTGNDQQLGEEYG